MKAKMIISILGIVYCAAFLFATHVSAEPGWYTCAVNRVGPSGNLVFINVSDTAQPPAFTRKWCRCPEDFKNQMLAVGLTAMTNGQTISIKIDPSVQYPTINAMYLNK